MKVPIARFVQSVHFEDYDGKQFERLVFAYHLRAEKTRTLEWYGQAGSDMGRDIWGILTGADPKGEAICIQCANRKKFSANKAIRDIDKVLKSPNGRPDIFRLVCASPVSARSRDKVKLHANSRGINRCEIWGGNEFEEYLRAKCETLLVRFVNGIIFPDSSHELEKFSQDNSSPCNLPHPPTPHFVRPGLAWERLLGGIASIAQPPDFRQVLVVHGLHGTGKTQAVCNLAWEYRAKFYGVFWIRGDTLGILRSSVERLCEILGLPEQNDGDSEERFSAVQRWLKINSGWLLVADNIDAEETRSKLLEWISPLSRGILLVTSRLVTWPSDCRRIEFSSWSEQLSLEFLVKRLGLLEKDKPNALIICRALCGLPLALEQSAAFIEQSRTPLEDYVPKLIDDVKLELARHALGSTEYPASFVVVLKHSFLRLTAGARFLLELSVFLASKDQTSRIYGVIAANCSPDRVKKHGVVCPLIDPDKDLLELNRWSLLQQRGEEFDVHPLVQIVIMDFLSAEEKAFRINVLWRLFFLPFGRIVSPTESRNWHVMYGFLPHIEMLSQNVRKHGDRRILGYILNQMGLFLQSQGFDGKAAEFLLEAAEVARSTTGPDHPDTAAALCNLGDTLTSMGRPADAKPLLLEAIRIAENSNPEIPHAKSTCWNNLGLCCEALGQNLEAQSAFRKALALDVARNGSDDDFGLMHQNNLANLLILMSRKGERQLEALSEAEKLYRNVIAKMKDEVRLARALTNLGSLLYETLREQEAIGHLERAFNLITKFFPPDHPNAEQVGLHLLVARKKAADRPS